MLDQSPIAAGSSAAQALQNTLDLARQCDDLGCHRYRIAEHHAAPTLAGAAPEALIGHTSQVADAYRANEMMIVTVLPDHAARRRS